PASGGGGFLLLCRRSVGSRRCLGFRAFLLGNLLLGTALVGRAFRLGGGRAVDELHQRHRRRVARARRQVQDARIAAWTGLEAGTEVLEQLGDDLAVTQAGEGDAAIGLAVLLRERDERLDHPA